MKRYGYSECFLSIQGEGHYTGAPSVFLRFWGCNFTCAGFSNPGQSTLDFDPAKIDCLEDVPVITLGCDTVYAWRMDFQHLSRQSTAADDLGILKLRTPSILQTVLNHFVIDTPFSFTSISLALAKTP